MQSEQWVRLIFNVLGDHGLMDRQKNKTKEAIIKMIQEKLHQFFSYSEITYFLKRCRKNNIQQWH